MAFQEGHLAILLIGLVAQQDGRRESVFAPSLEKLFDNPGDRFKGAPIVD